MSIIHIAGGFVVPENDLIGKWQMQAGRLDHCGQTLPECLKHIQVGDTVLDCGAYDGDHTIAYSNKVGAQGMVFALEPGQVAFECLKHNIRLFPFKNVNVAKVALSDEVGFCNHVAYEGNLGASKLGEGNEICVTTIDHLSESMKRLDFIKIDCEGYEEKILKGAVETIKRYKPKMVIEVLKHALIGNGSSTESLVALIKSMGYSVEPLFGHDINADQLDIFCQYK